MSMRSLGLSLWSVTSPRSSTSSEQQRGSQGGELTPTGFGLPSLQDPDPFGVRALELAGLEIKEAGSSTRPSIDAFEYRPSPTSPVFRLSTQSGDVVSVSDSRRNSRRNSKRNSKRSLLSIATDGASSEPRNMIASPPPLPPRRPSLPSLTSTAKSSPVVATFAIDAGIVQSPTITETKLSRSQSLRSNPQQIVAQSPTTTETKLSRSQSLRSNPQQIPETINEIVNEEESEGEDDGFSDEEDIVIEEVSTSMVPAVPTVLATPFSAKAKVVSIRRKGPPALPLKSPLRARQVFGISTQDDFHEDQDETSTAYSLSPDKSAFDKGEPSPNPWSEQTSLQDNESIRCKDAGRESLSLSDHDDAGIKSPSLNVGNSSDLIRAIVEKADFLLPSTTYNPTEKQIKHETAASTTLPENTESTDVTITDVKHEEHSLPDDKSSVSGSTVGSISDDKEINKSGSELNLASLIKQGLSEEIVDETDYDHAILDYRDKENDTSDYEDDVSCSTPPENPITIVSVDHRAGISH